ncbi:MAG: IMP dehydrogenase [archaeon]
METIKTGLSFDDVLLVPSKSDVLPNEVELKTRLTKDIELNIPLMSSAMDTVTESKLAIALAREGGLGIIHKNFSIEAQVNEVRRVKKSESYIVRDPITLSPEDTIEKALQIQEERGISCFPIILGGKLVGIVTNRDLRFKDDPKIRIKDIMTKDLIIADKNITQEKARKVLDDNRIEKLPIVENGKLLGLITVTDIEKGRKYPNACKDSEARLRVGAAIGPNDTERAKALIDAGVDILVIDTAHGHSSNVIEGVKAIKKEFDFPVIAGNIATADAAKDLVSAGADAVKVGVGPGSICTTRIIAGVGVPQVTAILDAVEGAGDVPVISDGGVRYSGDIAKAIAAGASCVMAGSMFGGTDEAPGDEVIMGGRKYKRYRGMGSIGAMMQGSKERYAQGNVKTAGKLVAEGVEGIVPYRGTVSENVYQLIGGLRSSMGYCGAKNINEMKKKSKFIKITSGGLRESHPHDITITGEAPNYSQ